MQVPIIKPVISATTWQRKDFWLSVSFLSMLSVVCNVTMAFQTIPSRYIAPQSIPFRRDCQFRRGQVIEGEKVRGHFRNSFVKTRHGRNSLRQGRNCFTALDMVFTTPASVIEQVSTKVLLDDLIDESVRTSARNPIMMQFDPSSGWIWRRWEGTVFNETWQACVRNMIVALVVSFVFKYNRRSFLSNLQGFNILWGQLLSVTTFTLTFFLNQSYSLWRTCYNYSRRLQGRLNDVNLFLTVHAARSNPKKNEDGEYEFSTYTEPARQVLELMARYTRVFNILTYASFTGSHRPLLTPQGMRRLVERGVITESERKILSDTQLPVTQRHSTILLWMVRLFVDARKAGHVGGDSGFEQHFLDKCHVIRSVYGAIGDELQGRMPLAYAHIVQVLVDVILWMYPFMALSTGMTPFLSVTGTGLLTIFYQGLFDLAKQFLDPYDNENYGKGDDPLCIDTLISETNAGSIRWMNGLAAQPLAYQNLVEGNILDHQLPLRGWSVEESDQREEKARLEKLQEEAEAAQKKAEEESNKPKTAEKIKVIPSQMPEMLAVPEIADDELVVMNGDLGDEDDYCDPGAELSMAEALEKIEACSEKVP